MIRWEWNEFEYTPEDIEIKKRNTRRINDSFISNLYNKSIYVFNNGVCYCFFNSFKNEPIYVYRYTDLTDNIIKYVGIVWSKNRTLEQRIKEHYLYDEWCNGKQWKVEYLEIDNKTDCEGLEGHFISLYETNKWYNKGKFIICKRKCHG